MWTPCRRQASQIPSTRLHRESGLPGLAIMWRPHLHRARSGVLSAEGEQEREIQIPMTRHEDGGNQSERKGGVHGPPAAEHGGSATHQHRRQLMATERHMASRDVLFWAQRPSLLIFWGPTHRNSWPHTETASWAVCKSNSQSTFTTESSALSWPPNLQSQYGDTCHTWGGLVGCVGEAVNKTVEQEATTPCLEPCLSSQGPDRSAPSRTWDCA